MSCNVDVIHRLIIGVKVYQLLMKHTIAATQKNIIKEVALKNESPRFFTTSHFFNCETRLNSLNVVHIKGRQTYNTLLLFTLCRSHIYLNKSVLKILHGWNVNTKTFKQMPYSVTVIWIGVCTFAKMLKLPVVFKFL